MASRKILLNERVAPILEMYGVDTIVAESKKGGDTVRIVIVRDAMSNPLGKQGENNASAQEKPQAARRCFSICRMSWCATTLWR